MRLEQISESSRRPLATSCSETTSTRALPGVRRGCPVAIDGFHQQRRRTTSSIALSLWPATSFVTAASDLASSSANRTCDLARWCRPGTRSGGCHERHPGRKHPACEQIVDLGYLRLTAAQHAARTLSGARCSNVTERSRSRVRWRGVVLRQGESGDGEHGTNTREMFIEARLLRPLPTQGVIVSCADLLDERRVLAKIVQAALKGPQGDCFHIPGQSGQVAHASTNSVRDRRDACGYGLRPDPCLASRAHRQRRRSAVREARTRPRVASQRGDRSLRRVARWPPRSSQRRIDESGKRRQPRALSRTNDPCQAYRRRRTRTAR